MIISKLKFFVWFYTLIVITNMINIDKSGFFLIKRRQLESWL